MLLKVVADDSFPWAASGKRGGRELTWTVSGAQPFAVAVPALKRMLGIVTPTHGFIEHGYDLYMARQTPEGVQPGRLLDVHRCPDEYNLRNGMYLCVRRLPVALLHVEALRRDVRASEHFDVVVRGTDVRGNPRPLPSGGVVKLALVAAAAGARPATLAGRLTQGSGDGVQTEFVFGGLSVDLPGDYRVRAELVHPSADAIDAATTPLLRVRADPHPIVTDGQLRHVGRHALRLSLWADRAGLLHWLVFASPEPQGLSADAVRAAALRGIESERQRPGDRFPQRGLHCGDGAGAVPGCIAAGSAELRPGKQSFDVRVRLAQDETYWLLCVPDNFDNSNLAPDVRVLRVTVGPDSGAPGPAVTALTVDCTSGGAGGLRVVFDAADAGTLYYIAASHGDYIPQGPEEFIADAVDPGRQAVSFVSSGALPIGPGIGHSMFLPAPGVDAGGLIDFWWSTSRLNPPRGTGPSHPERHTVLVPFEDPPQVLSFAVTSSQERPAIHVRVEVDYPGVLHYVVCRAGTGGLLLPSQLKAISTEGPEGDIVAAGSFSLPSAGTHIFTVCFPVPPEHAETQRCTEGGLAFGREYDIIYLADSRQRDNPAPRASRPYSVTLVAEGAAAADADADPGPPEVAVPPPAAPQAWALDADTPLRGGSERRGVVPPLPRQLPEGLLGLGAEPRCDLPALHALLHADSPYDTSDLPYPAAAGLREAVLAARRGGAQQAPRELATAAALLQQRVLDLESTRRHCNGELAAAREQAAEFGRRLLELQAEAAQRRERAEGLRRWQEEHLHAQREDTLRRSRELREQCAEVSEGNQLWAERLRELRDRNDALSRVAAAAEQRRADYINALRERCVRHSAQLHRIADRTGEVLELRDVRREQEFEIETLTALLQRLRPPPPQEEVQRTRVEARQHEVREPEPAIVTRCLTMPKGGLRALTTVRGSGLQALRFKYNVLADIVSLASDRNELRVTGESANVLRLIRDVETLYERFKLSASPVFSSPTAGPASPPAAAAPPAVRQESQPEQRGL